MLSMLEERRAHVAGTSAAWDNGSDKFDVLISKEGKDMTGLAGADGTAKADMRWEGVPIMQGGFRADGGSGRVEGRFWGSDHVEAGGVFRRNGITGAFGAKRQAAP